MKSRLASNSSDLPTPASQMLELKVYTNTSVLIKVTFNTFKKVRFRDIDQHGEFA